MGARSLSRQKPDQSRWTRPRRSNADEKFDIPLYGKCDRWLCRPSCFDIAETQLIRDIVKVTHESIGSDPKIINVLLFEHPAANMSISGRIHGEEAPKQVVEKARA